MQDPKEKQHKKFQKLDEEWRTSSMSQPDADIDKGIRDAAMNLVTLEMAKEFDEDLIALKEAVKTASEQYTEGKKQNLLKIEFLIEVLRSRGRDVPGVEDFLKSVKKDAGSDPDIFEEVPDTAGRIGDAKKGQDRFTVSFSA